MRSETFHKSEVHCRHGQVFIILPPHLTEPEADREIWEVVTFFTRKGIDAIPVVDFANLSSISEYAVRNLCFFCMLAERYGFVPKFRNVNDKVMEAFKGSVIENICDVRRNRHVSRRRKQKEELVLV